MQLRCARCGREGPDANAFGAAWARAAAGVDESLPGLLAEAWVNADGADVCPQCQDESDRRLAAERIAAVTQAAVISDADRGVQPSPGENAAITLAMRLREALLGRSEPSRDDRGAVVALEHINEHPAATVGRIFDVAVTGAFLTGCPLRVDLNNYAKVQADLAAALTDTSAGPGWSSSHGEDKGRGTYASGGGFSTNVPLVLVSRAGPETLEHTRTILDDQTKRGHDWVRERAPDWTLTPTGMRIEVYDVGVGVIDGTFSVKVPPDTVTDNFATGFKEIVQLHIDEQGRDFSAIASTFRHLCQETTTQFQAAFDRCDTTLRLDPWLRPPAEGATTIRRRWSPARRPGSDATVRSPTSAEWGRLLWLHPIYLLAASNEKARNAEAELVAPVVSDTMKVPDGLFVPGIGWSAIITRDGHPDAAVLKLVHLHWAYFALHMEIDRGLLGILNRVDTVGTERVRQHVLESEAAEAFDWYTRVIQARSRVDSTLAGLGGDEQAIWDKIAEVQRYKTLIDGVDRKVDALRIITDRRAQEVSSAQARRATRSLGLLAALGLVTLVIASFGYFFGSADPVTTKDRFLPFAVGFVVALALWWWINFSKLRRGRRQPNAGHRSR